MELVMKAWKSRFSEEIPHEFVTRLESELSKLNNKDSDVNFALSNVKSQTKRSLDELGKRIKLEEYFLDVIASVVFEIKDKTPVNVNVSDLYAKVNKSVKLKTGESRALQTDKVMSDHTARQPNRIPSLTRHRINVYEDIDMNPGKIDSTPLETRPKSIESNKRDSGNLRTSKNSVGDNDDDNEEGDYATLAVKPEVSPRPSLRRPCREHTYEEIGLPFLKQPSQTDKKNSGNESNLKDQSDKCPQPVKRISDPSSIKSNDGQYASLKAVKEDNNRSSQSLKHKRTPPPVPQKTHYKVGNHYDGLNQTETAKLKHRDKEPQLSSSLKKETYSDDKGMKVYHVKPVAPNSAESRSMEGDYCSLQDLKTDKHVTVLRVVSDSSKNKHLERGLSKSTESLTTDDKDNKPLSLNSSKSFNDIVGHYAEIGSVSESVADEEKSLDVKMSRSSTSSTNSERISSYLSGKDVEVTISSNSDSDDNEKLAETVVVSLGENEEERKELEKRFENVARSTKSRRNRVPDYEKWNFQTLLTGEGVSITERDLGDTGSEDEAETPYDHVDSVTKSDADKNAQDDENPENEADMAHENIGEDDKLSELDFNRRTSSNTVAKRTDAHPSTSTAGSRMSTLSCTTVDGDTMFHRSDSNDESVAANVDPDTISVSSTDEMLDKNDLEETIKSDPSHNYRSEQLRMRHLVVKGILESEKMYLHIIENLVKAKHYLQSAAMNQHEGVIALQDVTTIFYKMDDFFHIHREFVDQLTAKVKNWSDEQTIADAVKQLVVYFKAYEEYVNNYPVAVETIRKYMRNEETRHILEDQLEVHYKDAASTLEDVLLRPVQRIQTSHLVLHDLMKHTPEDHPDHRDLAKALKLSEENLRMYSVHPGNLNCGKKQNERHLVKSGFLVEVSRDKKATRQLRYVFLFNNVLVCTKHKGSSKYKDVSFKYLWYFPIPLLTLHMRGDQKYALKESLDELKFKIGNLKVDLREEMLKADATSKDKGFAHKRCLKNIEKKKGKIQELEATLVEALPRLPLHLEAEGLRQRTFLFSTDYEREEWREAIESQRIKCQGLNPSQLSNHDIEQMISGTKLHMQVNGICTALLKKDEEMLNGSLNVTIHKMQGLGKECDVYCCLEMDSYGHFYKKAQTRVSQCRVDALWNEDFELDLDGSQTLRILCYKKQPGQEDDVIIGKCALELSLQWLNSKFNEKTITMNDISITISIRHTPASKTLKRTQSKLRTGIFGVRIQNVTRRENKTVPSIVSTCVQEIEKRGMKEVGIYRVSGVTSDVQNLKKLFDKNPIGAGNQVETVDIHAITGVLKLYFRELPEPLFTDQHYQSFIQAVVLQNEETKEKCMLELLHSLPEANYYTIVFMIEHLVRIAQHSEVNKMSHSNLSTIFGPTLMHPAVKDSNVDPMLQMAMAAKDASVQSEVIHFFLKLAASGKDIRKSATPDVEVESTAF